MAFSVPALCIADCPFARFASQAIKRGLPLHTLTRGGLFRLMPSWAVPRIWPTSDSDSIRLASFYPPVFPFQIPFCPVRDKSSMEWGKSARMDPVLVRTRKHGKKQQCHAEQVCERRAICFDSRLCYLCGIPPRERQKKPSYYHKHASHTRRKRANSLHPPFTIPRHYNSCSELRLISDCCSLCVKTSQSVRSTGKSFSQSTAPIKSSDVAAKTAS